MATENDRQMTRSTSGFKIAATHFESVRNKQDKDLEYWKRKLEMVQEEQEQKEAKSRNLDESLTKKTEAVLEMHRKRQ